MKRYTMLFALLLLIPFMGKAQARQDADTTLYSDTQVTELLRNMPNVEVGKGVSFSSKDNRYKLTMRLRMQSLVGLTFDNNFALNKTEACIKPLHMRFDGHVFSR